MTKTCLQVFSSVEELAAYFTAKLKEILSQSGNTVPISVALSGGSTPKAIFEYIANNDTGIPWNKIQLFWGDERCVSPESTESNYRMAKEHLLKHIPLSTSNIFRIKGEEAPVAEAQRYAETVVKLVPQQNQVPQFDIILLGLGEDGHTASLFPGSTELLQSHQLFEATEHPVTGQKRITATLKLINNAKTIFFLVTGESKAKMVGRILKRKNNWKQLPAAMVQPINGENIWLLDEKAAGQLTNLKH
ncbi:MAG: 6-phosphogluconolactonase [Bacteroidales bacterium]|nr:6-phosphogluconolactonase [Bacteroidales bacterium]